MSADCFLFGFLISRNVESSTELYEGLIVEGKHNTMRKQGDYENRLGMTTETITKLDQHSICVLHSYMNTLGYFLKVI